MIADWSMTIVGYPPHQRSGARVVGISHMNTHAALRVAEAVGCYTGWLVAETDQPQVEGINAGVAVWVALAELFVERRIAQTEGVVSGSLVFAAAVQANGEPPSDLSLQRWAEADGRAWIQVIDNEYAYVGGLDDAAIERLLCWFLSQRPAEGAWKDQAIDPPLRQRLVEGLFAHGWTRNCALVQDGRKAAQELWGGVHGRCILHHHDLHRLSAVHRTLRVELRGATWHGEPHEGECPIDDDTGRLVPRRRRAKG